ncbi:DUF6950 family protein [Stakelama pacifica]|nr:hypothetical protein GCM10011329_23450 [Stakelama pacifica]
MLGPYLKQQAALPYEPGITDCCTLGADWLLRCGHSDPMREWRGNYHSDAQAEALIAEAGGLSVLWSKGLLSIGIRRRSAPMAGDVGIVRVIGPGRTPVEVGGIFTGSNWAVRLSRGMAFLRAEPVMAWGPVNG